VNLKATLALVQPKEKIVRFTICLALVLASAVQPISAQQSSQKSATAQTAEADQLPQVAVERQPGAPVELNVIKLRWATPTREILDIYLEVKNVGTRPIRAYATRAGEPAHGGCFIYNVTAPGKVIRAGESDAKSRFVGVSRTSPPKVIHEAIDFVEFTDGTTWGADSCETADHLAGERAGGRAAIEVLQGILKQEGLEAVWEKIKNSPLELEPPEDHSDRWKSAFRAAVRNVVDRVRRAYYSEGLPEVETTLNKPYDAAGAK
jgi:hypothetical protein